MVPAGQGPFILLRSQSPHLHWCSWAAPEQVRTHWTHQPGWALILPHPRLPPHFCQHTFSRTFSFCLRRVSFSSLVFYSRKLFPAAPSVPSVPVPSRGWPRGPSSGLLYFLPSQHNHTVLFLLVFSLNFTAYWELLKGRGWGSGLGVCVTV